MSALDEEDPDENESILSLFLRMYHVEDMMKTCAKAALNVP